jgi:hypothetical protein
MTKSMKVALDTLLDFHERPILSGHAAGGCCGAYFIHERVG